jgi:hypothetical protein
MPYYAAFFFWFTIAISFFSIYSWVFLGLNTLTVWRRGDSDSSWFGLKTLMVLLRENFMSSMRVGDGMRPL